MHAKIVILENGAHDSSELAQLLSANDYEVEAVLHSDAGLEVLRDKKIDCLFTDLSLIEQDNGGLLKDIRGDAELESVPVIVLANDINAERQISALHAGVNLCIPLPFNAEELLAQLEEQLRLWKLRVELREQLDLNQSLLRRLRDDLALGQQVQKSFLPPSHLRTSNFSQEARLIPSGDLSGDYYDYRLITPERLVIFLADVSGHGVASALLAGRIKAFFDENFRRSHRPRLFLEQLNQVLIDLGEHFHIATAVCLHIDVMETTMVYANAGHRTLYWLDTESDHFTMLPATGPALGMFDEFDITEVNHGFLPGRNRLVSYTDGLVEFKTNGDGWTTEDDFRNELLLPQRNLPLNDYFNVLLEGSRNRTRDGEWDDDVSLMITDF